MADEAIGIGLGLASVGLHCCVAIIGIKADSGGRCQLDLLDVEVLEHVVDSHEGNVTEGIFELIVWS